MTRTTILSKRDIVQDNADQPCCAKEADSRRMATGSELHKGPVIQHKAKRKAIQSNRYKRLACSHQFKQQMKCSQKSSLKTKKGIAGREKLKKGQKMPAQSTNEEPKQQKIEHEKTWQQSSQK